MKLTFLGACREVGRSCMVAEHEGTRLAIDVGMKVHDHNEYPQGIANLKVDASIVTHAHLDHSGALPYFYKPHAGRVGMGHIATFCTPPTIPFSLLLLEDAEKVAIKQRKPGLATKKDLIRIARNFFALQYEKPYYFAGGLSFSLYDAGHIAGAAQVLVEYGRKRLLYSGDFKLSPTRMHEGVRIPEGPVDALVVESCYAMREQPERKALEKKFCEGVRATIEANEVALVPSFAVGRTQEVLQILDAGRVEAEVYVDGMGQKTSMILRDFPTYVRNYNALTNAVRKVHFIEDPRERKKLLKKPCVIVATAGMCLHPNSFVHQADGLCRKIKDVQSNVYSLNGGSVRREHVSRLVVNPAPDKLVKVRTALGDITCTAEHKFAVLEDLETHWKKAGDLREGDYVAAVKNIPFTGREQVLSPPPVETAIKKARIPRKTNPKFSQFLGYFIGGAVKRNKIVCVADKDEESLRYYQALGEKVFKVRGKIERSERKRLLIYSSKVARFLKWIEPGKPSHRRAPEFIQKAGKKSVAAFLRGLFDAEGTVSVSTNKFIFLSSSSEDLVGVVQLLLLRFGIHAENRKISRRVRNNLYVWYTLRINKPDELVRFAKEIGFSSKAKNTRLKMLLKAVGGGYGHYDIPPLTRAELYVKIREVLGVKEIPQVFGRKHELYATSKEHCTVQVLEKIVKRLRLLRNKKAFKNKKVNKKIDKLVRGLMKIFDGDVLWTKVLEKETVQSDTSHVFDLTVPTTSNYIANGLVVHNCDGGPALGYLVRLNNQNKGKVFLTGWQVEGTNGRNLIEHRRINVEGREVKVRIPFAWYNFSAHASRSELFYYVDRLSPEKVFVVHGDEKSCISFARELSGRGYRAVAPRVGEKFDV